MIAIATLQTIWDCRWSRPGYRVIGVEDHLQPEKLWVCVRRGDRQGVAGGLRELPPLGGASRAAGIELTSEWLESSRALEAVGFRPGRGGNWQAVKLGANVTLFLLFFGISLLDALRSHDWLKAVLWLALALVFLRADALKPRA